MNKKYLGEFETVYNNIDYLINDIVIEDDEVNGCLTTIKEHLPIIKQALQGLTQENELLKEIIKSFFDRGCPLHQYIDKEGVLTIEVDDECSTMRLGEFKGVDLDAKLKEVLK